MDGGLIVIAARTVSNKTKISQYETQQCPVPQDLKISSEPALCSFMPSTSSVVAVVCAPQSSRKHVDACGDQVNGTSVQLVLLEARNKGGGRGNPSERVRARPRGRRVVSLQRLRLCRLYAESKPVKIQQEDEKLNSKRNRIKW